MDTQETTTQMPTQPQYPTPTPDGASGMGAWFANHKKLVIAFFIVVVLGVGALVGAQFFGVEFTKFFAHGCITGSVFGDGTGQATNGCTDIRHVTLAIYKAYDAGFTLGIQTLFDHMSVDLRPGQSIGRAGFHVSTPNCYFQIDLIEGDPIEPPNYGSELVTFLQVTRNAPCAVSPTPRPSLTPTLTPSPIISGSPTPSPSITPTPTLKPFSCLPATQYVDVNENANMIALGGSGNYSWTALGGNPPSGTGDIFSTQYPVTGTKTVMVSDGTRDASCTVIVLGATPTPTIGTTPGPTPLPPTSLTATPGSQACPGGIKTTPIHLQWSVSVDTADTVRYLVQRSTVSGGPYITIATVTAPTTVYNDLPLSAGTYYYVVVAVNIRDQQSLRSNETKADFTAPVCPSGSVTPTPTITNSPTPTVSATTSPTPTSVPTATPLMSLAKTVRNITQNGAEVDVTSANPADTVEFVIRITSNGSATVLNVRLTDALPSGLTYIAGSTTVDNATAPDGILSVGLSLGDMVVGKQIIVRFRAAVADTSYFVVGTTTLTNTATVRADNLPSQSDVAFVNVVKTQSVVVGGQTLVLDLKKYGRNVTRGESGEQLSVTTLPNDTVEFIVRVTSLSSVRIDNVVVKDVVPNGITYISNTTSVNGITKPDDIISAAGLNVGSLDPNQTAIVRFSGRIAVASSLPVGLSTVINTARASATNIPEIIAQLPVLISNGTIAGVGIVPTGASQTLMLALGVSAAITLAYIGYTHTGRFRRKEAEDIIEEGRSDKNRDNFLS